MSMTVADFVLKRLREWGVQRVFGYPGDGINGLMGAFGRADNAPEFIQARHEELAAFMACGHAKFTGEPGVCLATSGPGAIHLLNGLYDARMDHQPVVAIVGQQKRSALGGDYQQEVDLTTLMKDVARDFVAMAVDPAQVRHLVDRAVRIAVERRTVTCIIIPNDVQNLPAVPEPPREHGTVHTGIGYTAQALAPQEPDLRRAADVLNAGSKVAMLVGAGALNATDEVIEVAGRLGAGVAKALLGKAAVPDDLPFVTGSIGLLGTKPSWELMNGCDTLLMVGSAFPYSEFLPKEGKARGVQIDIDGRMLNLRYPMEICLEGDSAATLRALLPMLEQKPLDWQQEVERNVAEWWQVLEQRAAVEANPINPQRVFTELSQRLPDNCILTCDSGSAANWYARDIRIRRGMMASLSGGLATMGPAVPYAIAARYAHPERAVIAMVGDGAMQMNGISALITISRDWKRWTGGSLTIIVLNNGDLNQVTWEQRVMEGDPKFAVSQDLPAFGYAAFAQMLGLQGIRVDRPEGIGPALDQALAANVPTVLEMVTDPDVPPLPPHISVKQARAYISAMLHGDTDAGGTLRATFRQVWESLTAPSKRRTDKDGTP